MYPKAYVDFLVQFHGFRDYFECHEILEEHWKSDTRGNRKDHWVGLIQIAVSLYHQRRDNISGAKRMMESAVATLQHTEEELELLGLDSDVLLAMLRERIEDLEGNKPYVSMNLPIKDKRLVDRCEEECKKYGCQYGVPSDLANDYLIHKHTKRDRTDVITERNKQKQLRKKRRGNV